MKWKAEKQKISNLSVPQVVWEETGAELRLIGWWPFTQFFLSFFHHRNILMQVSQDTISQAKNTAVENWTHFFFNFQMFILLLENWNQSTVFLTIFHQESAVLRPFFLM